MGGGKLQHIASIQCRMLDLTTKHGGKYIISVACHSLLVNSFVQKISTAALVNAQLRHNSLISQLLSTTLDAMAISCVFIINLVQS